MDIRTGQSYIVIPRLPKALEARIVDINGFWVTFEPSGEKRVSEPLEKLLLSWENSGETLKILLKP